MRPARHMRRGSSMLQLAFWILSIATTAAASMPYPVMDANTRYVRAEESSTTTTTDATYNSATAIRNPSSIATSSSTTTDPSLRRAMSELHDALSDTRRIMDGEEVVVQDEEEAVVNTNVKKEGEDGEEGNSNTTSDTANSEDGSTYNTHDTILPNNSNTNHPSNKQHSSSSDWWERLYQGGPLYDETTGKLLDASSSTSRPVNRRSHSATVYRSPQNNNSNQKKEWMIISGGFTDDDWNAFPVWAYDMTESRSIAEVENEIAGNVVDLEEHKRGREPWVDLTPGDFSSYSSSSSSTNNAAPQGRVGHLSSVHNDCLYVFGGLTYRMGTFHVDYGDEEEKGLAIWKACGLDYLLSGNLKEGEERNVGGLKWERVLAKVDTRMPVPPSEDGKNDQEENDNGEEEPGNWRLRRNRRTLSADAATTSSRRNQSNTATITSTPIHQQTTRNTVLEPPDPSYTLPRGEAQGGHYPAPSNTDQDSFVFYGGMHHHHTSLTEATTTIQAQQVTTILGDVWKFEYESETLRMLSPYPPLSWQRDERNGGYPKKRTAHAATIVNHQLILHGGMYFGSDDDSAESSPSSFSSPSNTYATYKTSSRWQPLSDVWVFDLKTLKWKERVQYPQLARSYHSMVGWGNGTVAAFGGFQQDNNIPGETVAFVFKDLLLSRPNETYWQKLLPPYDTDNEPMSRWRASSEYTARPGITNRLEHTAVVDQFGSMYIWGGRFQTVSQIVGLWRLDVFNEGAKLEYEVAPPDGIEEYEAELEALHMFIATMMFMSLMISSLFSMMRRNGIDVNDGGGGGGSRRVTRRGLSRQVLDSLPLKRYEAMHTEVTDDGDVVEDVSLSRENSQENESNTLEENMECCPICLVQYEDGVSEIRTLPCGHVFDRECIDAWFADHTTCPSCRQNIGDTSLLEEEEEDASSPVITVGRDANPRWRFHSHWDSGPLTTTGADEGEEASAVSDAIQDQYESDPRWQFLSAFEPGRRRHSHWDNGMGESSSADVSSQTSNDDGEETTATTSNNDDHPPMMFHSITPRFLGVRRLFSRRGHVGVMAVPGEEYEEETEVNHESIELV